MNETVVVVTGAAPVDPAAVADLPPDAVVIAADGDHDPRTSLTHRSFVGVVLSFVVVVPARTVTRAGPLTMRRAPVTPCGLVVRDELDLDPLADVLHAPM